MDALDGLIERYDLGAIVTVYPYMPDNSGEILRWDVEIDGKTDPDVDVRLREEGELRILLLVTGGEEFELWRWDDRSNPRAAIREPAMITWSLRQVREVVDRNR
jgi:hypothetical protein